MRFKWQLVISLLVVIRMGNIIVMMFQVIDKSNLVIQTFVFEIMLKEHGHLSQLVQFGTREQIAAKKKQVQCFFQISL